ncbi:dynein axonemal heavy chain 6-like isoform X2 [Lineus longissimus]|uniref:dynein axonemal heavy chain 6-like isoform X2 n=1 Tax=Lineus longissimus TaxID=88925 RepID=UPI00315D0467
MNRRNFSRPFSGSRKPMVFPEQDGLSSPHTPVRQPVKLLNIQNENVEDKDLSQLPPKLQGKHMLARLYDRPEMAQVYRNIIPSVGANQELQPHPPKAAETGSGSAFRTTLFKRDYADRQNVIKNKYDRQSPSQQILPLNRLPKLEPSKLRSPLPNIELDEKETSAVPAAEDVGQTQMLFERRRMPAPLERPGGGAALPPAPGTARERRPSFEKQKPRRVQSAKITQDPSLVLTYLKKNIYDDEAPENDDAIWHITEMRRKLNWKTELPRHGPACREQMRSLLILEGEDPDDGMAFDAGPFVQSSERLTEEETEEKQRLEEEVVNLHKGVAENLPRKEDNGQFVYCLPRNRLQSTAKYDPYDLQVVSPNEARMCQVYWTVSASSITQCIQGTNSDESNRTSVLLWLWEKRLGDVICKIPFFAKFRLRKSYFLWRHNMRQLKNDDTQAILTKRLFTANEILQGCILHVRGMCEAASGSLDGFGTGHAAIILVNVDKSIMQTLPEFMEVQRKQGEHALEQLNALRKNVVDVVWESCTSVAEMEGVTQGIRQTAQAKKVKIEEPGKKGKNAVGKKAKADKPYFAQIAEWRKVLARLADFLRAIDNLILELLQRLVNTAVKVLLQFFAASFRMGERLEIEEEGLDDDEALMDADDSGSEGTTTSRGTISSSLTSRSKSLRSVSEKRELTEDEKLKELQLRWERVRKKKEEEDEARSTKYRIPRFDFDKKEVLTVIPDADDVLEEIKHQDDVEEPPEPVFSLQLVLNVPAPIISRRCSVKRGVINVDVTASGSDKKVVSFPDEPELSAESETESEESASDEEDSPSAKDANTPYAYNELEKTPSGKSSIQYGKSAVLLSPTANDFKNGIRTVVQTFENTVGQVVSMLREPRLAVFCSATPFDLKLNIDQEEDEDKVVVPWPNKQMLFGDDPDYQAIVTEVMEYLEETLDSVEEFSKNYETYCQMVDKARKVDVDASMAKKTWSPDDFLQVLSTHTEQVNEMDEMRKDKRLYLIHTLVENFCKSCLPYPQSVLKAVGDRLPVIANSRNEDLLTIIKGALKKLDYTPVSVEEFVDHLSFLGRMVSELPALEKEFIIVTKMFTIAKDFNVHLVPEELALYQTLAPSFQHLKSTILYCEAKKEENIRKYSGDLDTLILDIRQQIYDIKNRVLDPTLLHHDTLAVVALENIKYLQDEVETLGTKARSYANYQERFGTSMSSGKGKYTEEYMMMDSRDSVSAQGIQSEISEIERDLTLRRLLWESVVDFSKMVSEYTAMAFEHVTVESLQKNVNRFTQTVYMLEKGLPHNEVLPRLKEKVLDFKQSMPVVTSLRNPSLRARHWQVIEKIIGKVIVRDKGFTLGDLLAMNILKHKDRIQDISTTASNEATLEIMLQKVIDLWQSTDFRLLPHAGRDTFIIAGADDIVAQLEESQVTVGTIRGSRYVTPIKNTVEEWERRLTLFARTLDEWMICQRNWLYIEQIFSTPDIQRQLPNEAKLFISVDKSWKDIMRRTEDRPNALKSATAPGVYEMLQSANANLEKIQKCLEDYLETKRLVFPRFYFLSNDDLLDILAQSKDPDAVQPHLDKCFGNIKSLEIRREARLPPTVITITSSEGEVVSMPKNVRARGPVEQWLGSVENGMFETVKKHLKMGLIDVLGIDQEVWVLKHPGQVVLTVSQIMFNKDVSYCFGCHEVRKSLIDVKEKLVASLNNLAGVVGKNVQSFQRLSIEALLITTVHNRDIIMAMIENKVDKKDDFEWRKQLKYEWDEQSNNCNVLQSNATFVYGYEYLGCSPRLVITPLTDRCYLTLTGALHLHLGGSPAGPAGTGKTETVKDLAKAMGKQCVVFNCSEGLDFKMLGKFFSGLAQSGSWCCFDEFNRIDVEVLSVVAQQILTIKSAKDSGSPRFLFEGRDIKLNTTCGIFITMNPTYAGRVELPDNLKSLFRSVAMMVPDYNLIAEIMLFSEGFRAAKSLSRKIVNLYQLASKQLSQQDHYDFGMRAIKSVLVMAGQRKRATQQQDDVTIRELTEEEESYILIHALTDANLPKFLAEDVPLFESILADLFPGVTPPQPEMIFMEKSISMSIRDQSLQHWPSQIEKVKQLYNQLMVRHGVMLVGPTGGGKTTARGILQRALVLLPSIYLDENQSIDPVTGKPNLVVNRAKKGQVETFTINPKCIKLGELYGETDPNTFEWSDGLIAMAMRKFSKDTNTQACQLASDDSRSVGSAAESTAPRTASQSEVTDLESADATANDQQDQGQDAYTPWKWLILDGPVDTLWVENLNTVLDDSKILCLANGERISLTSGMRLIFEVDNLSQASPATISRCAMVYMDPVDLGWRPYVRTWLQRLGRNIPEMGKKHLEALFNHSMDRGLDFVSQNAKEQLVPAPEMSLVMCLCNILSAFFDFINKHGGFAKPDFETARQGSDTEEEAKSSTIKQKKSKRTSGKKASKSSSQAGLDQANGKSKVYYIQKNPNQFETMLGKMFVFAYVWSIGGNFKRQEEQDVDISLTQKSGEKSDRPFFDVANEFDNLVHELFDIEPPLGIRLPAGSKSIYSYFLDMESGNFVSWDAMVPSTHSLIERGTVITIGESMGIGGDQKKGQSHEDEIVPTVDTVRYTFLTSLLVLSKNPVLLNGESGVGKSAIIHDMLKRLGKEGGTGFKNQTILGDIFNFADKNRALLDNISSLTKMSEDTDMSKDMNILLGTSRPKVTAGIIHSSLQFSAQTTSARTQAQITYKLIKKGKDTLGGPKGRKVVVFVDDLNMPAQEQYGAQPPLELLRQFLDIGGFYDTQKLVWKDILDVTLVAACGPPGGGRNQLSPRLLKHFCMLALPQPSTRSLQHIYQVQLGQFLQENEFMPEVKESLFSMVSASIAIYYRMCAYMRPTPAKVHYTFNIRDLSKVVYGLFQADEGIIVNKDNCAQLLANEATRVFHDRLINAEDREIFYKILADNLHDYFKVRWTPERLLNEPVVFCDFLDSGGSTRARVYRPISDNSKLAQIMEELYMRQNAGNTQASQMVFFKEAIAHIVRAARVFRQPGGHMLLIGMDGTGKATTVQLACYVSGAELFQLTLTKTYSIVDFRDDLKMVFKKSGVQGLNMVFLLTDSDIVNETFLEDINCILNSGEVPDLFDNEELDGIAINLKRAAAEADVPDTRNAVYEFFIQRVKKNLHVVLTMSPAGNKFRQRCRMNPALINCCTIDWYDEWDEPAMLSVAQVYFQNAHFISQTGKDLAVLKESVSDACVRIHLDITKATRLFWEEMRRRYYTTPSSFMELIKIYAKMLEENKTEFVNSRDRLLGGLNKLSEANSLVGTMQEELVALGPRIEEKAKETEVLLKQLEKDQVAVEEVKAIVEKEREIMAKETQAVHDYADECQRDLASVLPALQTAIASLDALNKADIAEIRVYQSPPILVKLVLASVCVLMRETPDWQTAKKLMGDQLFLTKLIQFDKNNLPEKVFYKLKKYTTHDDFNPETIGKVSLACKSICQWVLALEHYNEVHKMVKPKQKRVSEAKEALQLAQESLQQKEESLNKIMDHLTMLQGQYQDSVNQREELKQRKVLTAVRLERASLLIEALSGEKDRWKEMAEGLDFRLKGLVGDTLVSAATVAYLGAFTAKYRKEQIQVWVNMCKEADIPISEEYDFVRSIVDATQVLRWHNLGLPNDTHSTENAVIVKKSRKWPLLIDPQGQASNWIMQMEGHNLKVVAASDPQYMRTMERGMRVGEAVLLVDVGETLDPSLKPILLHETFTRGGHKLIKIGDTEIEYNDHFRLYLATSMSNPHYLPAVCIQVTIINFTVTFDGLQEQLLSSVVRQEKPELEEERGELLESIAADKQLQRDTEDRTLYLLNKTEGNILDDQDLISVLQKSKGMAREILSRVEQSERAEQNLNNARKKYLPVATRGATLYFVLADLSGIDVMYQFSLDWFQNLFIDCIESVNIDESSPPSAHRTKRIMSGRPPSSSSRRSKGDFTKHMIAMIDQLTISVYQIVSVAMFAHHQLMFSFMLCTSIMRSHAKYGSSLVDKPGSLEDLEWTVFLQGSIMASIMDEETLAKHDGMSPLQRLEYMGKTEKIPRPQWVTEDMWRQCQHLEATLEPFGLLCRSVLNNHIQWESFHSAEDPYHLMETKYESAGEVTRDTPSSAKSHDSIRSRKSDSSHSISFPWDLLTPMQRLLLIKVLSPALLTSSVRDFIEEQMSGQYLYSREFDLKDMYEESTAQTPIIFILSPGSDPTQQLFRFAKDLRGSTLHLDMISLGRGQGPKAEELISKAQILKGRWVFLQNCHLAASWMPKLETIVEGFRKPNADVDPQFRLWLSSKPDPSFPISILQTGLKMTVEPPQGLKNNLLRSFGSGGSGAVTEKLYQDDTGDAAWRNLLFGLCFFNAVIHERKKYGSLGWNIPYGFNDSDLEVSLLQLEMLLKEHEEGVPWAALQYLTGEVTYGGRVTDDWDRRCLHSLLHRFYCPESSEEGYTYSPDGVYHPVSANSTFNDVRTYIESLPNSDSPELFGMNDNAEQAYLQQQARELVETIASVQPRLAASLIAPGKTSDELVLDIASDIMRQLPEEIQDTEDGQEGGSKSKSPINLNKLMRSGIRADLRARRGQTNSTKKPAKYTSEAEAAIVHELSQSALITVLRQEVDRFNTLLLIIHKSLKELCLAVKGEVVMSESLEEAYNSLLVQKVPEQWKNASYASCKSLGPWVHDLVQRVDFFSHWLELVLAKVTMTLKVAQGQQPAKPFSASSPEEMDVMRYYPRSYWLSAFFFPQGFLTGVLQNHARRIGVSVDSLVFDFEVQENSIDKDVIYDITRKVDVKTKAFKGPPPPDDGVLVFGLYIDGACWDLENKTLHDSLPGERFSHLPEIHFIPKQVIVHSPSKSESTRASISSQHSLADSHHTYECPLYRTSARAGSLSSTGHSTNFVTSVNVPSDQSPDFWIMRGVALLCQLDS